MDFQHGTSRHKILHIIAKNGGSIPSANSAYNLTRGIKSDLGRATLAQDRTTPYHERLIQKGYVEQVGLGSELRITPAGRAALAEANQKLMRDPEALKGYDNEAIRERLKRGELRL